MAHQSTTVADVEAPASDGLVLAPVEPPRELRQDLPAPPPVPSGDRLSELPPPLPVASPTSVDSAAPPPAPVLAPDDIEPSSATGLGLLARAPSWLLSMVVHLVLLVGLALIVPAQNMFQGFNGSFDLMNEPGDGGAGLDDSLLDALSSVEPQGPPVDAPPATDLLPALPLPPAAVDGLASVPDAIAMAPAGLIRDPRSTGAGPVGRGGQGLENEAAGGIGGPLGSRMGAEHRRRLALKEGGTPQSLEAVALALQWLAEHQDTDGSWSFAHDQCPKCRGRCGNPGMETHGRIAATSLALLPFLGNGQTHQTGEYRRTVDAGLRYLIRSVKMKKGAGALDYDGGQMYAHGLGSIVLCEAYAMTGDSLLRQPAQAAIEFIVDAQDRHGGGWRYRPGQQGDTSVVGWQLMALQSGHLAKLKVPAVTVHKVEYFLDSVQSEEGALYGYLGPGGRPSTSAIGLLCRMYLGWPREHRGLTRGVYKLAEMGPSTDKSNISTNDMYYNYYATQVLHHYGGYPWENWNKVMRDYLVGTQATVGHERGSWYLAGSDYGASAGGRLYFTAMAAMTLEVYYRFMPLYQEDARARNFFKP